MPGTHHPEVVRRDDGRWEVRCPDCTQSAEEAVPIGIGLAVGDPTMAAMIRANHLIRR